jgi:hypothetical protein
LSAERTARVPGPYVAGAFICEKTLQEADGVLSFIRVIDRVGVQVQGAPGFVPDHMPDGRLRVVFVVMLKSGDARGRIPVSVLIEQPDGATLEPRTVDVTFEGEDRGINLVLNIETEAIEGLYWFTVTADGRELTRSPLRVIYQRMPTVGPVSGSG